MGAEHLCLFMSVGLELEQSKHRCRLLSVTVTCVVYNHLACETMSCRMCLRQDLREDFRRLGLACCTAGKSCFPLTSTRLKPLTKQPPLWGRRAGNGFFFGVEFCKIDQGTAHTIHAKFSDVGSTTRNWFGCFMFSLSKINLKKSIKGWARWRRRPSSSLKLCLF